MEKNQEILAISRLAFELTLVGATGADLDKLLLRLFDVLATVPGLQVRHKGAILLYNPRRELVQVAQVGLPPTWDFDAADGLAGIVPEFRPQPYLSSLAQERDVVAGPDEAFFVLSLQDDERPLGLALLFVAPGWAPDAVEVEFMSHLARTLTSLVSRSLMTETLRVREIELEDARSEALRHLGTASEYRDNETGMHVMRMTHYASAIAKALGLPIEERERLAITAPMHDVGKIGIADSILLKPGKLSSDEYDVMKTHTDIGARILNGHDSLIIAAREIAAAHHEHWDGSGYPRGLKGTEIPIAARICAVADVFDALTSHRPYKDPWPFNEAVEQIRQESGTKFDPAVVEGFNQAVPDIQRVRELYRDDIIDPNQVLTLPDPVPRDIAWVAWDDSLSVGIDVIDEHHRYLVSLINDLFDTVSNKLGSREVARVLKALAQYARVHFRAEERMMDHYGHDAADRQRHQHDAFLGKLKEFGAELHDNPLTAQFDVLIYLREWLVKHIRIEDAKLRYLKSSPGN